MVYSWTALLFSSFPDMGVRGSPLQTLGDTWYMRQEQHVKRMGRAALLSDQFSMNSNHAIYQHDAHSTCPSSLLHKQCLEGDTFSWYRSVKNETPFSLLMLLRHTVRSVRSWKNKKEWLRLLLSQVYSNSKGSLHTWLRICQTQLSCFWNRESVFHRGLKTSLCWVFVEIQCDAWQKEFNKSLFLCMISGSWLRPNFL